MRALLPQMVVIAPSLAFGSPDPYLTMINLLENS